MSSKPKSKPAVRHRKILRDNIQGLTKPAIKRMAQQAGILRINGLVYDEIKGVTKMRMEDVLRAALTLTQSDHRKTVSSTDILNGIESATGEKIAFDVASSSIKSC